MSDGGSGRRRPGGAGRWGIADALIGLVIAMFLATVIGGSVVAARHDYTGKWSESGASAGRIAAQLAAAPALSAPKLTPLWLLTVLQIPLWAGLLGTVVFASRKGADVVRDFGLRVRRGDIAIGATAGIITQLVVIPIVYIPILWLLDNPDLSAEARSLTDCAHGVGIVLLVLLTVIGAPIVEELFFRGLVLRSLLRRMPSWAAITISSLLFALVHFQALQFVALAIFGAIVGVLAVRTGRLGPSICAHMAFNATTVIALLLK